MSANGGHYSPRPVPRETVTRCKRSCCWTPYGHTHRDGCTCHEEDT